MTTIPENLKYTKDHEWIKVDGEIATIGITDYAQNALGDIVFVELPDSGEQVELGDAFGVVESIKSVSDLLAPLSGEVIEKNENLEEAPELCNESPYDTAWMVKIKMSNISELEQLLNQSDYQKACE